MMGLSAARCESTMDIEIDGCLLRTERCSLEAGHDDCHALIEDGVDLLVWCDDGNYDGPRGRKLLEARLPR